MCVCIVCDMKDFLLVLLLVLALFFVCLFVCLLFVLVYFTAHSVFANHSTVLP